MKSYFEISNTHTPESIIHTPEWQVCWGLTFGNKDLETISANIRKSNLKVEILKAQAQEGTLKFHIVKAKRDIILAEFIDHVGLKQVRVVHPDIHPQPWQMTFVEVNWILADQKHCNELTGGQEWKLGFSFNTSIPLKLISFVMGNVPFIPLHEAFWLIETVKPHREGPVYVYRWSRDCDMVESWDIYMADSFEDYLKGLPSFYSGLEGPGSMYLVTEADYLEAQGLDPHDKTRDRITEAWENGNGNSIIV